MTCDATDNGYNRSYSKEEYERFYTRSDFKHFGLVDRVFIKTLVQRYQLEGGDLLDVGCGTGWYTHLFTVYGARAWGVDVAEVGVRQARDRYALAFCLVGDGLALPFSAGSFDAMFLSGFPPYNARDLSTLSDLGNALFSVLKPGGIFVFHKTTDLSGRRGSRMNHTLQSYEQYLRDLRVGSILGSYAVSPLSWALMGPYALSRVGTDLCCLLNKITRIPLRALIVMR